MPPIHEPGAPHPHGPHVARWLFSSEGELSPTQAGELLKQFGEHTIQTGFVELGEHNVVLPERVRAIVRHERAPRGELVLKVELSWLDGTDVVSDLPISSLIS